MRLWEYDYGSMRNILALFDNLGQGADTTSMFSAK